MPILQPLYSVVSTICVIIFLIKLKPIPSRLQLIITVVYEGLYLLASFFALVIHLYNDKNMANIEVRSGLGFVVICCGLLMSVLDILSMLIELVKAIRALRFKKKVKPALLTAKKVEITGLSSERANSSPSKDLMLQRRDNSRAETKSTISLSYIKSPYTDKLNLKFLKHQDVDTLKEHIDSYKEEKDSSFEAPQSRIKIEGNPMLPKRKSIFSKPEVDSQRFEFEKPADSSTEIHKDPDYQMHLVETPDNQAEPITFRDSDHSDVLQIIQGVSPGTPNTPETPYMEDQNLVFENVAESGVQRRRSRKSGKQELADNLKRRRKSLFSAGDKAHRMGRETTFKERDGTKLMEPFVITPIKLVQSINRLENVEEVDSMPDMEEGKKEQTSPRFANKTREEESNADNSPMKFENLLVEDFNSSLAAPDSTTTRGGTSRRRLVDIKFTRVKR